MSGLTPKYSTPLAGDIILCGASWNVLAQRILRPGTAADYSHAAVMCSINWGVQAMPDSGVDAFGLHQFLTEQVAGSTWKVYRHVDVDTHAANQGNVDIGMRFGEAAKYFMGQSYNFGINMPEIPGGADDSHRSFCSQLVARIYDRFGTIRPHSRRLTSTVLPSDLQSHFADNKNWLEVTSIYSDRINWVVENHRLASAIKSDSESIEIIRSDLEFKLAFQENFACCEHEFAAFESDLSLMEKQVNRQYKHVTGTQLASMPRLDMTSHLREELARGARSNWRARVIFKRHRWRQRLQKIWLTLKAYWN